MAIRKRASSRTGRSSRQHHYESLQPRRLLASFSGTSDVDVIEVAFAAGVPTSITINGVTSPNADSTLQLTLPENTEANAKDDITFSGDTFNVDIAQLGRSTTVNVNSAAVTIDAASGLALTTGPGDDSFSINHEADGSGEHFDYGRPVDLFLGDGNDRIEYGFTPFGGWELGEGDDTIFGVTGDGQLSGVFVDMGSGTDRWQVGRNASPSIRILGEGTDGPRVGRSSEPFVNGYSVGELEWVVSVSPDHGLMYGNEEAYTDEVGDEEVSTWRLDILGNAAWFSDGPTGHTLGFYNFNRFRGDFTNFGADSPVNAGVINVRQSNYDLEIDDFARATVGGGHLTGDTSQILGEVSIQNVFHTTITNASSADRRLKSVDRVSETESDSQRITGLTPQPITIAKGLADEELVLFGSNTTGETFVIKSVPRHNRLSVFGLGGDDFFFVGARVGFNAMTDLDRIKGVVSIVDGDGDDYLIVNDGDSDLPYNYRLRNNWVHHAPSADLTRDFAGVWFDSVEKVRVNGGRAANRFRVTPSLVTSWTIDGTNPTVDGPGWDWVDLVIGGDTVPTLIENLDGSRSYFFGNDNDPDDEDEKLIVMLNVEANQVIV